MSVESLQYFKKFGAVNQKTAKFAIFLVLARFRLRIMRIRGGFRFSTFGVLLAVCVFVWSFSRNQKIFSEICKKLLTFPFRCAILEANNGFGVCALRSLLRKTLTFSRRLSTLCNLPITSTPL